VVLAGGSNMLVHDTGYDGVVISPHLFGRSYVPQSDGSVLATYGASEVLDTVIAECVERGWWGLENLSHIPGTVGATPVQNVGAYGVEVASLIETVTVYDADYEQERILAAEACMFQYRDSIFKRSHTPYIITAVTVRLSAQPKPVLNYADLATRCGSAPSLSTIRDTVISIRSRKFPDWHTVGTAGSFFKNPIISEQAFQTLSSSYAQLQGHTTNRGMKVSLGWILDHVCGLRGYQVGPVRLYEAQALVLVASRGATADMIDVFATEVAKRVYDATGITIEREVRMIGAWEHDGDDV
jgi:UDP-N-acetylmuramate dehydrogenase